jgi:hypothetical protein
MRGLGAVVTLGVSELVIGTGDFLKRCCPACDHPMNEHTVQRQYYEEPVYPRYEARYENPPPCSHPRNRLQYAQNGDVGCLDCGGIWDRHGRPG